MKVLDQGKWQNPWTAEVLCKQSQCGAKLLIGEDDVKAPDYSQIALHIPVLFVEL